MPVFRLMDTTEVLQTETIDNVIPGPSVEILRNV